MRLMSESNWAGPDIPLTGQKNQDITAAFRCQLINSIQKRLSTVALFLVIIAL